MRPIRLAAKDVRLRERRALSLISRPLRTKKT